jgi:D-alanyl-D-alanine carboxypeptidase
MKNSFMGAYCSNTAMPKNFYLQAMKTTITTLFTILILNSCNTQEMKKNEIEKILLKQVEDTKTPSVQYVIFNQDSVIHQFRLGFADIKNKLTVKENTTCNAYSVTKTFTALSILQLAEQNKIEISQPVIKYLPEFPYSSAITVQQLLTHSAGIPNPIPLSWIHLADEHQTFNSNEFFAQIFKKNEKTKFRPDEKYSYSNLGYVLLGQIIEKVSGSSYENYVRENIIKPLNINPGELDFKIPEISKHAKGYHKKFSFSNLILGLLLDKSKFIDQTEGKWLSFKNIYVNDASYGGLIGTTDAFVKYIQELLKPQSILISNEYKELLFSENHTSNNKATGMCLAWFSGQLNGKEYFAHAGGGGGYYCEIRIYPDLGIGSVIMFNRTGMTDERFLDKLDKHIINGI